MKRRADLVTVLGVMAALGGCTSDEPQSDAALFQASGREYGVTPSADDFTEVVRQPTTSVVRRTSAKWPGPMPDDQSESMVFSDLAWQRGFSYFVVLDRRSPPKSPAAGAEWSAEYVVGFTERCDADLAAAFPQYREAVGQCALQPAQHFARVQDPESAAVYRVPYDYAVAQGLLKP